MGLLGPTKEDDQVKNIPADNSMKSHFDDFTSPLDTTYYKRNKPLENNFVMSSKEKDKKNEGRRTRQVISEWASNASCHGIPNIERSTHVIRRIIWTLLFLAGAVGVCYLVRVQILLFFSYPVNISVNVTHTREMIFPAVTICNVNPARKSMINLASSYLEDVFKQEKSHNHGHHAGRHQIVQEFQDSWAKVPQDLQHDISHQRDDFIIDCFYNGHTCYPSNFTTLVNPIYGNCFTFNDGHLEGELLKSTQTGPHYGLALELDIEQDEYISALTETAGARLLVHPPDRMPFPEDEGYYLEPGQLNSIGIRTENITRLGSPYPSHCIDPPPDIAAEYSIYSEIFHVKYTVQACMKTCLQKYTVSHCNCSDPTVPNDGVSVRTEVPPGVTIHPCTTHEEVDCEHKSREEFSLGHLPCDCPSSCLDVSYMGTISQVIWPNDVYADELKESLSGRSAALDKLVNSNTTTIEANLIKVEVFFEELNYILIKEEEAYNGFSLLSDVGGIAGLYLGVSLVALFEFVELLIDLFSRWSSKICNLGKTAPNS